MLGVVDHQTDGIGGVSVTRTQQRGGQQGFFQKGRKTGNHAAPAPVLFNLQTQPERIDNATSSIILDQ
ncbi:hypothetical protein D3C80_1740710 [compost metagenome]